VAGVTFNFRLRLLHAGWLREGVVYYTNITREWSDITPSSVSNPPLASGDDSYLGYYCPEIIVWRTARLRSRYMKEGDPDQMFRMMV